MELMEPKPKTCRCQGCGDFVEYQSHKPKWCPECRKTKQYASIARYKRNLRKLRNAEKESRPNRQNVTKKDRAAIGGMSIEAIARTMQLNRRQVEKLEAAALGKIRVNPELKKIWGKLKDELADGAVFGGSLGQIMSPTQAEELLLEYQMSVMDWWQTHQEIMDLGCSNEAIELLEEITKFQNKIKEVLNQYVA